MPFDFKPVKELPGVVVVEPRTFRDDRGYFLETFKSSEFAEHGIEGPFVQDNHSHSKRGVLRGLHYQAPPAAQGKLVSCVRGRVFDVAVDIRHGSPTFGEWFGIELTAADHRMLWVPEGFAHGFYAISDEADVAYKVTHEYSPDHDRGIRWDDPDIGIEWPIDEPLLSAKDAQAPVLADAAKEFSFPTH